MDINWEIIGTAIVSAFTGGVGFLTGAKQRKIDALVEMQTIYDNLTTHTNQRFADYDQIISELRDEIKKSKLEVAILRKENAELKKALNAYQKQNKNT
jgi:hypothetical protein